MFCIGLRLVLSTGSWKRRQVSHCTRRRSCSAGQFPFLQFLSGHTSFINNPGKWQCPETEKLCQSKEPLTNLSDIYACFLRNLKGFKSRILLALLCVSSPSQIQSSSPRLASICFLFVFSYALGSSVCFCKGDTKEQVGHSYSRKFKQRYSPEHTEALYTTVLVEGPMNVPCSLFPYLLNQLPKWLWRRLSKLRELKPAWSPRPSVHLIKSWRAGKP